MDTDLFNLAKSQGLTFSDIQKQTVDRILSLELPKRITSNVSCVSYLNLRNIAINFIKTYNFESLESVPDSEIKIANLLDKFCVSTSEDLIIAMMLHSLVYNYRKFSEFEQVKKYYPKTLGDLLANIPDVYQEYIAEYLVTRVIIGTTLN